MLTKFLSDLAGECGAPKAVKKEMSQAASGRHFQEIAQAHNQMSLFPILCQKVCEESHKLLGNDAGALVVDALCFDFNGTLLGHASTSSEGVPLVSPSRTPLNG